MSGSLLLIRLVSYLWICLEEIRAVYRNICTITVVFDSYPPVPLNLKYILIDWTYAGIRSEEQRESELNGRSGNLQN